MEAHKVLGLKMASLRPLMTMENLPEEVLSEIFIRLLAKQLAQMRCVCKSWNALLSESSFVKSHLHRSIHHNDKILLFFDQAFSFDCCPFTTRLSHSPDLELNKFIKPPLDTQSESEYSDCNLIGSVNGLICFSYESDDDGVVIWNPSLSAMLTLPSFSWVSCEIHYGFGYDPKTDDYKVVKLGYCFLTDSMVTQGEVYSMRKGSWESVPQKFPSHITLLSNEDQVCVDGHDGHLHWLGYIDEERTLETIVDFDLGAETFREIPLPDSTLHHHGYRFNKLGVLAGKLCVMSCARHGQWEVWVMNEYGVAESWVKHHVFPSFSGDITPYGFTPHNEFLCIVDEDEDCFGLYDPIEAKTTIFKIALGKSHISKIVEYVDSLVWIEPATRLQI